MSVEITPLSLPCDESLSTEIPGDPKNVQFTTPGASLIANAFVRSPLALRNGLYRKFRGSYFDVVECWVVDLILTFRKPSIS